MGQDDCLTEKSGGGLQAWLDLGVLNGYELQTGEVNLACLRVKGLLKVNVWFTEILGRTKKPTSWL